MERSYELEKPVVQEKGTKQCWWLSLLEVARDTDKLKPTFKEGGIIYAYYTADPPRPILNEGDLPAGVKSNNAKLEVYGPEWQRMIMFFLLDDKSHKKWRWHTHTGTLMTSDLRIGELKLLLGYLGVTGITLGTPHTLVDNTVLGVVNGLPIGQWVLVDKKNVDKNIQDNTSHAMSGIVKSVQPDDPKKKAYNTIVVFNQSTKNTFECSVKGGQLLSKSGNSKLNWILPLTIA